MFRLRGLLLNLWKEEAMSLRLVQADIKMSVGLGQRVTRNVPRDGAGQGTGTGSTPLPKENFSNVALLMFQIR